MEIRATSLNFPNLLIVEHKHQMKPPLPFVPGSGIRRRGAGRGRWKGPDVFYDPVGEPLVDWPFVPLPGKLALVTEVTSTRTQLFKYAALGQALCVSPVRRWTLPNRPPTSRVKPWKLLARAD